MSDSKEQAAPPDGAVVLRLKRDRAEVIPAGAHFVKHNDGAYVTFGIPTKYFDEVQKLGKLTADPQDRDAR